MHSCHCERSEAICWIDEEIVKPFFNKFSLKSFARKLTDCFPRKKAWSQ